MCFPQNKQKAIDTSLNIHLYFARKEKQKGKLQADFRSCARQGPLSYDLHWIFWVWLLDLLFSSCFSFMFTELSTSLHFESGAKQKTYSFSGMLAKPHVSFLFFSYLVYCPLCWLSPRFPQGLSTCLFLRAFHPEFSRDSECWALY